MSMNEPKTEWIRLVASPTDKALLETITQRSGDDNLSATVRRLIRQEAMRLGLVPAGNGTAPDAEAVAA
jgi:hypothetical protein